MNTSLTVPVPSTSPSNWRELGVAFTRPGVATPESPYPRGFVTGSNVFKSGVTRLMNVVHNLIHKFARLLRKIDLGCFYRVPLH